MLSTLTTLAASRNAPKVTMLAVLALPNSSAISLAGTAITRRSVRSTSLSIKDLLYTNRPPRLIRGSKLFLKNRPIHNNRGIRFYHSRRSNFLITDYYRTVTGSAAALDHTKDTRLLFSFPAYQHALRAGPSLNTLAAKACDYDLGHASSSSLVMSL